MQRQRSESLRVFHKGLTILKEGNKEGILIFLIALLVYSNSLLNGFVWDDNNVILTNELLKGSPLKLFKSIDTTRDYELLPYYRPIAQLSFWLEWRLHGFDPFWMHLFNVLLHSLNALFVYLLVRRFSDSRGVALCAGLLFAIHPINTETVNFLSGGRNTMLASVFSLLALILYNRAIEKGGLFLSFLSGISLLIGLFSKESALMMVLFILLLELKEIRNRRSFSISILRVLPVLASTIFYLVMRWNTLSALGIQRGIVPGLDSGKLSGIYKIPGLMDRLLANIYMIPRYFQSILWPVRFNLRYELPSGLLDHSVLPFIAWFLIIGLVIWSLTKGYSRLTLLGLCWSVIFYLPVSGIFIFPSAPMADRYIYLPAMGLWVVLTDQGIKLVTNHNLRKYGVYLAFILFVTLFFVTFQRNSDWMSDMRLFGRFVRDYPEYAYSHSALGNAYYAEREKDPRYLDLAESELLKATEINPLIPGVHTNIGNIRLLKKDYEGAIHFYTIALGIYPLDKEALLNRAITYELVGKIKEAIEDFRRFLAVPGYELADARPYAEARIRELTKP